jgi:pyruvate dehydrogenase E1 component alpha subunit
MNLTDRLAPLIYEQAALCRAFEEETFRQVKQGSIKLPVYLSAGQEYTPATLSAILDHLNITQRQIFIQHRGHSTYLSFNGNMDELVLELLGDPCGCAYGMGGSASIHSVEANIYGHDGLMGSHGPISVGMCYANRIPTLCFIGDAAAEEDYFLGAIGWASTKKLPIIFIVEDNNLSILTEKKVRRNWEMDDVARAMHMKAFDINDDPQEIIDCLSPWISGKTLFSEPILLNIRTNRLFWHAGAGIDSYEIFDRHQDFGKRFEDSYRQRISEATNSKVNEIWKRNLSLCAK